METIMKFFSKVIMASLCVFSMTACAGNQAAQDYYVAMQAAANANASVSAAKYEALARLAQSGDPGASTAAVMAIALTKDDAVTPQYIENSALKWAQVLASPVATLGGLWIQSDVAKNASNNAKEIQMASFDANTAIQLGQQGMVGDLVGDLSTGWSTSAAAGGAATADIAIAGFTALNTAGGQTADVAIAGMTTIGDVATAGFTQIGATAEDGINATSAVGLAGMTSLVTLGTTGIAATENTGISLGTTGMTSLVTQNDSWLDYSTTRDANISGILADFNATIQQLGADLATPITCTDDGSGNFTCQ